MATANFTTKPPMLFGRNHRIFGDPIDGEITHQWQYKDV
jgi:hypothetical protein